MTHFPSSARVPSANPYDTPMDPIDLEAQEEERSPERQDESMTRTEPSHYLTQLTKYFIPTDPKIWLVSTGAAYLASQWAIARGTQRAADYAFRGWMGFLGGDDKTFANPMWDYTAYGISSVASWFTVTEHTDSFISKHASKLAMGGTALFLNLISQVFFKSKRNNRTILPMSAKPQGLLPAPTAHKKIKTDQRRLLMSPDQDPREKPDVVIDIAPEHHPKKHKHETQKPKTAEEDKYESQEGHHPRGHVSLRDPYVRFGSIKV